MNNPRKVRCEHGHTVALHCSICDKDSNIWVVPGKKEGEEMTKPARRKKGLSSYSSKTGTSDALPTMKTSRTCAAWGGDGGGRDDR